MPGIPTGWQAVTANGEPYQANFVKIAINIMRKAGSEENVLPDLLHAWFGEGAGLPGKTDRVIFNLEDGGYVLRPRGSEGEGPQLWREYMRAEIPALWEFEFSAARWNQGFVQLDNHIFLLVSLEKAGMQEAHQYEDKFLAEDLFQWVSQNRQSQESSAGQAFKHHRERDIKVHLFVRPTRKTQRGKAAPYFYCGDVEFVDWEGSKPIEIRWRLKEPVPVPLREAFGIT